jgi:hypothetical protein
MKKETYLSFILLILSNIACSQSVDDSFSQEKMLKDLKAFKNIRLEANSGLYKYRTKKEIDSIYNWAEKEIEKSRTYLDFYNIIFQLTDFEGSSHNSTNLPSKYSENLKSETFGYFPYPVKWIDGKWRLNFDGGIIPVGSEIMEINDTPMSKIIDNLYKYYTTDGENLTGKRIGIRGAFPKFFRWHYGQIQQFSVTYKTPNSDAIDSVKLKSIGYGDYIKNVNKMYSMPIDAIYYADLKEDQKYRYKQIDASTALLTVYSFSMGNETTEDHKTYLAFLDKTFSKIKTQKIKNLIVDVRYNSGGTDPNDLVTYSYLTQRNFQENKQAWISFKKIPYVKYIYTKVPRFLRPFGIGKYNKSFTEDFYIEKGKNLYQGPLSRDQKIREPNENAFTGNIYLLIGPQVASAASLFAAMVAGNENSTVIGEETVGGYYGHNGHRTIGYILPKSKIETFFSVVNLEQDVPKKANQMYNRGVIPDINVTQTFEDYLLQKDTQMAFTLELIKKSSME